MQLQDDTYELVLFDLDGTLVDTAPDMVAVLQRLLEAHGRPAVPYEHARSFVSHGALGLLSVGFPASDIEFGNALHQEYLAHYADNICSESSLFDGLDELLADLESSGIPWGVVTNKPQQLTQPLMAALGLAERAACIVSGDTLAVRKPDPAPVLLACDIANVAPEYSLYIGDADRDIEAGRRAGTATIAAAFGYVTEDDDPREWNADIIAATAPELTQIVLRAIKLDD